MAPLTLVIGNKNYSSWSLRAWLFMKHVGVEFQEILVALDTADTHDQLDRYGPSGRVPVLRQGKLCVWDSLAICEYVEELSGKGWPKAREARAVARSVCAEMHSGFTTLRSLWPMNARARNRRTAVTAALEAGVGVALQPDFVAWESVQAGRLTIVLQDWSSPPLALNLVTPSGGPRATRISVLMDFLARRFLAGSAPWTLVQAGQDALP